MMFNYPVGVQLFNRPDYAEQMLLSLKGQTLQVNQGILYIFIDGFKGSIYEKGGSIDKTSEVEDLAKSIFPNAKVIRFERNCGIADLHNKLQLQTFSGGHKWATFFEEDLILDESYLQELSALIEIVDENESVVKVACFQIIPTLAHLPRGYEGFYPGHGTQAFAERKIFFIEKQPLVLMFNNLVASDLNHKNQFMNSNIASQLAANGHFLTYIQHDSFVESILHSKGKFHVVTKPNLCRDIGFEGIHSYVTNTSHIYVEGKFIPKNINIRKQLFADQFMFITQEAYQNRVNLYKDVIENYYISRSRRAMIEKIFSKSIKRRK